VGLQRNVLAVASLLSTLPKAGIAKGKLAFIYALQRAEPSSLVASSLVLPRLFVIAEKNDCGCEGGSRVTQVYCASAASMKLWKVLVDSIVASDRLYAARSSLYGALSCEALLFSAGAQQVDSPHLEPSADVDILALFLGMAVSLACNIYIYIYSLVLGVPLL
jgi:hypothetical protein